MFSNIGRERSKLIGRSKSIRLKESNSPFAGKLSPPTRLVPLPLLLRRVHCGLVAVGVLSISTRVCSSADNRGEVMIPQILATALLQNTGILHCASCLGPCQNALVSILGGVQSACRINNLLGRLICF